MKKKTDKKGHALHIKRHTLGTSNEISFSILDAAKNKLDNDVSSGSRKKFSHVGRVSMFTLQSRHKKKIATPTKEKGLPLSNGAFVSAGQSDERKKSGIVGLEVEANSGKAVKKPWSLFGFLGGVLNPVLYKLKIKTVKPVLSSDEEIARRKNRRRRERILAILLLVTLGLSLVVTGGIYLYINHEMRQTQLDQLNSALELVRHADGVIVSLDKVVEDPFSSSSQTSSTELLGNLKDTYSDLEQADQMARDASEHLPESKDKEAANEAVSAIAARRELVDKGKQVLKQAAQKEDIARQIRDAWNKATNGDELSRGAAEIISDTTEANVVASKDKSTAARDAFVEAQGLLQKAAQADSAIDISSYLNYLAKRIEATGYAIASDDAILAKDTNAASQQNDAYNTADAEAVALAKELPDNAGQPAYDAFYVEEAALLDAYSTARSQAGAADAFLRDYLGMTSK